jgi:hypothetical protein
MKLQSKARVALAAIAAIAIIGGTVASNAATKRGRVLYSTTAAGLVATAPLLNAYTTTTGGAFSYVTTINGGTAVFTRTIPVE